MMIADDGKVEGPALRMVSLEVVNPKQIEGLKKVPYSYVPAGVISTLALAMYEGKKYGRHNYRVMGSIKASIYYDALMRHINLWWEGEDEDPDTCDLDSNGKPIPGTGLPHWVKAMACLTVLGDATMTGRLEDDRPPKLPSNWMKKLNDFTITLNNRSKTVEPFTERNFRDRVPCDLIKFPELTVPNSNDTLAAKSGTGTGGT